MPVSPDVDLEAIEKTAVEKIIEFAGDFDRKVTVEPVAFGLKSISIIFIMDESQGSPDQVADMINEIEDVNSAEIVDVRRAVG